MKRVFAVAAFVLPILMVTTICSVDLGTLAFGRGAVQAVVLLILWVICTHYAGGFTASGEGRR